MANEYAFQDTLLSIDINQDQFEKRKKAETIQAKQLKEQKRMQGWGIGLGLLGAITGLGPLGFMIGKQLGTFLGDWSVDWEDEVMDPGKYYVDEAKAAQAELGRQALEQNQAQVANFVVDLGKMWMMSGGQDAFGDADVDWDPTTYGSGDAEWNVFGKDALSGEEYSELIHDQYVPGIDTAITPAEGLGTWNIPDFSGATNFIKDPIGAITGSGKDVASLKDAWSSINYKDLFLPSAVDQLIAKAKPGQGGE